MQDSHFPAVSNQRSAVSGPARVSRSLPRSAFRVPPSRSGFTLTELLVVIAIIAILAGLIAAAAVNALRASKRNAIVLEIKNVSGAIENFKTDFGAYPPNAMSPGLARTDFDVAGSAAALAKADFVRMFKKAFPRHQEPAVLIEAMAGVQPPNNNIVSSRELKNGMRGNEALVFWLGGFSNNEQYPISGEGGPSFLVSGGEILEDRNRRYEFDLGLLGPRTDAGAFNDAPDKGRFITYAVDINGTGTPVERRINFWQFTPKGSDQPLIYFDVSRHKPGTSRGRYDAWAANPDDGFPAIYALKQRREGFTGNVTTENDLAFVNQGKFQLIHAGLDNDWGSYAAMGMWGRPTPLEAREIYLFPSGPFIGAVADNLSNFTEGTLADASEE